MKTIVLKLTDENVEALQPFLNKTNRDLKNFIESLYLCAIKKGHNGLIDINEIGKINAINKA